MSITLCTVTGNVQSLLGAAVQACNIVVTVPSPFFHSTNVWISGQLGSTTTDVSGNFSIPVIETATPGQRVTFTFHYSDGTGGYRNKSYYVVVPNQSAAILADLVGASTPPDPISLFPASNVSLQPILGLTSTNVQDAFSELVDTFAPTESPVFTGTITANNISGSGLFATSGQIVGGSITADNTTTAQKVQSLDTTAAAGFKAVRYSATNTGPNIVLAKSRGATIGSLIAISSGDVLGTLAFRGVGTDQGAYTSAVAIVGQSIGTIGSNIVPGLLDIQTANASGILTSALTVDSSQQVTADSTVDSSSTTTGAVKINGGIGVAKSAFIGGSINNAALTASQAVFTDGAKNLVSNAITGSGNVVMSTSPTLVTPALGTPSSLVGTNITGTASSLTAGNVTTNANLTGVITSVGNATSIASQTGTGTRFVVDTSPTLVTPNLGTPSALVGTNISGTAASLTAGNVSTNHNMTGPITGTGNVTSITAQTGTGTTFVMNTSPTVSGATFSGSTAFPGSTTIDSSGNVAIGGTNGSSATPLYSKVTGGANAVVAALNTTATNGGVLQIRQSDVTHTFLGSAANALGAGAATDTALVSNGTLYIASGAAGALVIDTSQVVKFVASGAQFAASNQAVTFVGSKGPAGITLGTTTAPSRWLKILDSSGTASYIPLFQ